MRDIPNGNVATDENGNAKIQKRIAVIGGLFTAAVGAIVLIGWVLDIDALKSVLPDFISMKANTALSFLLLGGAVALAARKGPPGLRAAGKAAACAVSVIGGLTLVEYFSGIDLGIDEIFFVDDMAAVKTVHPGRMAEFTAILFLSYGAIVAIADRLGTRTKRFAAAAAVLGFFGAYRAMAGYLLHDEGGSGWFAFTEMALHTSVAFIVVSPAILLLPAFRDYTRHFVSGSLSGRFLRRVLPFAFFVPLAGHLLLNPFRALGFSEAGVESLDVALIAFILSAVLVGYSGLLRRTAALERHLVALQYGIDHAHDAIFMTDTTGTITYVNEAFEKLYGWTEDEVVGKTTPRVLKSGAVSKEAYENFWKTLTGGSVVVGEIMNKTKDGTLLTISGTANPILDRQGKIIGYMGIQHDVTARRKAELDVAEQRERLNDAQRIAKIGSWTFDPRSREVTWSDGLRRLLGVDASLPVPSYEERRKFYAPESWERLEEAIRTGITDGRDAEFDMAMFRADGTPFFAHLRGSAVRDKDGVIAAFQGTLQDVTEQRRAAERIAELDAMKNKFVQIVSHQLRTPLTSVRWALEEILDRKVGRIAKAQEPHLKMAMEANTDVILTVSNLIEAMDIEEGRMRVEKEEACFEDIMRSACAGFEHRFVQRALIHRHDLPDAQRTCGRFDPRLIREAITRFLDNAISYSNDGGTVVSRVTLRNGRIRFEIADEGIGIPKAEQSRVWDRFYRASNATIRKPDGCGLGLFIVKAIVEGHGGTVGFTSEEGKGSTFWFEIPQRV